MKDRIESALALIADCEAAMAKCRGILAELNMERVVEKYVSQPRPAFLPPNPIIAPDPGMSDDPPSRAA